MHARTSALIASLLTGVAVVAWTLKGLAANGTQYVIPQLGLLAVDWPHLPVWLDTLVRGAVVAVSVFIAIAAVRWAWRSLGPE